MKKIFIRSPYFITVDEVAQTSAKIEIFLWNKGTTEPTDPAYTLSKDSPSATQTEVFWNVSNFAKDFIKPISPVTVTVPTEENVNTWCFMKVKSYSNDILTTTETFICLNGYTTYLGGYNNSTTNSIVPLVNNNIKIYKSTSNNYINVFFTDDATGVLFTNDDIEYDFNVDDFSLYKLPINTEGTWLLDYSPFTASFKVEELCEPKYTPLTCSFINRFGGWQFLTFFKLSFENIETTNKEFSLMPDSINYNVLQGQKKIFNPQGKQSIRCNTGWVDENYFELIQDLLLSETVLLDNKPVIVKSRTSEKKTHLKDKNINYEIEFEFNYGLINDVI
jgi:hypothetical protein